MRRLLAAALCAMAKGQNSSCGPVRVSYDHAGFGNAFDVLFVAFHWARRCNSRVEIVGDESDRLRRICERLTCAGAGVVANGTCPRLSGAADDVEAHAILGLHPNVR